jgi:predicted glycosyltransferase
MVWQTMNERIRQLLSQAGVHYEVLPKDTVYEKFAELIVRECISIAVAGNAKAVVTVIKERFGVES